jgi:hypothetical protein
MSDMVDRRGGYGFKQVDVSKAIPHTQAMEMAARFRAKGMHGPASRAMALSRRSGRVQDLPKSIAFDQRQMRDKLRYRHEMALALRDEGMEWSPPKRRGVSKGELQIMRNGKNVLHLQPANPEHKKIWGAPARMLVVGSGEKRPAGRILLPTRRQWANWGGGGALAVGGTKVAHDRHVKKGDDNPTRRRLAGAAAGAGATDLALNVGGWGTREGIKYHESLVNAGKISHPMSRKARTRRLDEHKALHGVGSNTKDAPQAYYREWPEELPGAKARRIMGHKNNPKVVATILGAGALGGAGIVGRKRRQPVRKVDTTMSDREAKHLAARYDTKGPLPKGLTREQKMKAYEARYVATGGRKAEKWKRRADAAEVGRNVGLAGATGGALLTLAARSKKAGPTLRKIGVTAHRADNATIASAAAGGAAELYGEHARSRRASYQNSPGGVAASALSRMQAYTPEKRKS